VPYDDPCMGRAFSQGRSAAQVIREARPCHLYFDLEFVPAANPGADGDALVAALLRLVADKLRRAPPAAGGLCVSAWSPLAQAGRVLGGASVARVATPLALLALGRKRRAKCGRFSHALRLPASATSRARSRGPRCGMHVCTGDVPERRREWGLALAPDWVWELDSTTGAKWSRHLLVRLPGAALRDTAAAGAFVAQLLARPEASALPPPPSPPFALHA